MMSVKRGEGMANPVVHFEVVGKDATKLKKFYGEAFGWQLEDVMEGSYYMANTGGEGDIPGGIGASPDGGSGHVMFYVQVDDPARGAREDQVARWQYRKRADGCARRTNNRALRRS
jgi:predicted enzyme related to lactoylglutathione lyase